MPQDYYGLSVSQAAATAPVTTDEGKSALRVRHRSDDDMITRHIATATAMVHDSTMRQLVTATFVMTLDGGFPSDGSLVIPRAPLIAITSIKYYDTSSTQQTVSTDVYKVQTDYEPGRVVLKYDQSWPSVQGRPDAIEVTFTAGYGAASAVPEGLKDLVLLHVKKLYSPANEVDMQIRSLRRHWTVGTLLAG